MEIGSLAASAIAGKSQQTRDGFAIAALKIANEQQQAIASLVSQTADIAKAQNQAGVGGVLDVSA